MERYPNLKDKVGSPITDCEISSRLDIKLAKWSIASCALAPTCWPSVSRNKNKNKTWSPNVSDTSNQYYENDNLQYNLS